VSLNVGLRSKCDGTTAALGSGALLTRVSERVTLVPSTGRIDSDLTAGPQIAASPTMWGQIDVVLKILRRRYKAILVGLLLALPFGALYLRVTPPSYTASATMLMETRKNPLDTTTGNSVPDLVWIDTQIGVLKSTSVASYVVKQLRLADDPQFVRSGVGPLDKLLARFGWGPAEPRSEAERVEAAMNALSNGLDIKRVGGSYLMRVEFRSPNEEQAVKIANAAIDGYIFDQLNSKYQVNRRASDWLQDRLQALREQAATAERAAIEFRTKNNIVTAGPSTDMNEKEVSQMADRLTGARAQVSELQVRLGRISAVRQAYQQDRPASAADETVAEAMNNPVINSLRGKYLDLINRESDWSARYGKNHAAVVNIRNQIRDIRKSIRDELGQIEETTKSEYEIAKKRQEEAEKQLAATISRSTDTNQAKVALFSLEAAAASYRRLYDNFLQRHTESIQQQTFPVSDARPISSAVAVKTGPRTAQVWLITVLAGGALGAGFGAFRELMDRGFRTREQVRSLLSTECLALVPMLTDGRRRRFLANRQSLPMESIRHADFATAEQVLPRRISCGPKIMRTMIDSPWSPYAEAVRSLKLTVDLNSQETGTKILGLTSALPSEGKSSIAVAMASLIASGGARVLLVDCDVRNPSLSRALSPEASSGLLDVIAGKVELANAIWNDPNTEMAFLPVGRCVPNASELLACERAKLLFDTLQIRFDYVVVDLPPIAAGVDVRATSNFIDSYVLVIEWGTTKTDAVQYALRNAPGIHANIAGVVLNKVDMDTISRYDSHSSNYYYYGRSPS
jgi:succinoglycan biosynthesis transport protein ExoP